MRALAEFIMRGRLQACATLLISLFLPVFPQGVVGLVTLRKGARDGALLVSVALIPPLIVIFLGNSAQAYFEATLLGLLAVLFPAIILRATTSWSAALQGLIAVSLLTVMLTVNMLPALLSEFRQVTALMMAIMNHQALESLDSDLPEPAIALVTGFLGLGALFNGLTGLLLARWWQALLYNPGGFSREFHQLQLGLIPSSLILLGFLYCASQGQDYLFWTGIFAVPLILVAIAIIHCTVKQRQLNNAYLLFFYVLMIVFSPILLALVILGYVDCWLNIRKRLQS